MNTLFFIITQEDIQQYAQISNDHNPIHLDEELAQSHGFPSTVAHGLLTMAKAWSIISASLLIPTDFPKDYELKFPSPVYADDVIALQVVKMGNRMRIIGKSNNLVVIKGFFYQ